MIHFVLTINLVAWQELQVELEQDQVIHASGFSPSWLHIPRITAAEFCIVRFGFMCGLATLMHADTIVHASQATTD